MKKMILMMALVFIFCGCKTNNTTAADGHKLTRREQKCLARVKVLVYDQTQRPPSAAVEIYDETRPANRPVHEIAFLTCEGAAKEEIDMTQAIIEKAREMGADAIVILGANMGSDFQMGHGGSRAVFRAKAVVYDTKK